MNHSGALTPEMLAETEKYLSASSDGLSHGAIHRLRIKGLSAAEISAKRRRVSVQAVRSYLRSLDHLFSGTIPAKKSAALTNSYVCRELLNHPLSPELESYVKARLRDLQEINPDVRQEPLQTRAFQYKITRRKRTLGVDPARRVE